MPREPIAITGLGMASSLGMDAENACAAARAGITRPAPLACMNFSGASHFGRETIDGVPQVTGHACQIGAGFTGRARLALLGAAAFSDLLRNTALTPTEQAACSLHVALSDRYIEQAYAASLEAGGVPEHFPYPSEAWKSEARLVLDMLVKRCGAEITLGNINLHFGGHAGFGAAIEQACTEIRSGQFERAIIGAIDSCIEPASLEAAASTRLLKTGDNPVGFSPGEGAAFILVEKSSVSTVRGVRGRIVATGFAEDVSHQFSERPPVGNALATAVRDAISSISPNPAPSFVVADLNGTERRALDWGHAVVRLGRNPDIGNVPLWLPAASFGETGAASGALAVCMAVRAFERRYAPGERALILLASDSGARASLILERAA
jgi:3-oxoacyl-[acyl-carrier-protein] synthase-1